jgi:hypothetical protein
MVVFNDVVGVAISTGLLGAILYWKAQRNSTIWVFLAAVACANSIFASQMKLTFCS